MNKKQSTTKNGDDSWPTFIFGEFLLAKQPHHQTFVVVAVPHGCSVRFMFSSITTTITTSSIPTRRRHRRLSRWSLRCRMLASTTRRLSPRITCGRHGGGRRCGWRGRAGGPDFVLLGDPTESFRVDRPIDPTEPGRAGRPADPMEPARLVRPPDPADPGRAGRTADARGGLESRDAATPSSVDRQGTVETSGDTGDTKTDGKAPTRPFVRFLPPHQPSDRIDET